MHDDPYPKAAIPTDPVLAPAAFGRAIGPRVSSVLDAGNVLQVTSGRMAIGLALQQMGVGPGDLVLMPAYHSRSMVEPVLWRGAQPVFYRVQPDTAADLEDITAKITPQVKVLVVVNYFGFPQDLVRIRAFCDTHGLLMLEDCAHAFMGAFAGRPLGTFGDYAIASTMKLFPVVDGGCLVSARHQLDGMTLVSAGMKFELKTAFNTLERAFAYGHMRPLALLLALPMWCKDRLWGAVKSGRHGTANDASTDVNTKASKSIGPKASDGAFGFETQWLDKRASMVSRLILKSVSKTRAAAKRRANYLRLQTAFADLPGCAPLYPALPADVVPWVFPLLVAEPDAIFPVLKNAAVPVVRFAEFLWDGVDATVCPVSVDLSRRVMQFPCHQALRAGEIDWMIAQVRAVVLAACKLRLASAA